MLESKKIIAVQACEAELIDLFTALEDETGQPLFKRVTTNPAFLDNSMDEPCVIILDKFTDFEQPEGMFEIYIKSKSVSVDRNRELTKAFILDYESEGNDRLYLTDSKYPARIKAAFHKHESVDKADTTREFTTKIELTVDLIK